MVSNIFAAANLADVQRSWIKGEKDEKEREIKRKKKGRERER